MRTQTLPASALKVIKRNPYVYTALRSVRMGIGQLVRPRQVAGVPGRVHVNDHMFISDDKAASYLRGAENVIGLLERSVAEAGTSLEQQQTVIDFGSGYGRVIRLLAQRVDPSGIYAADVNRQAVEYCAKEFGVQPIYPPAKRNAWILPPADLIYAISVFTHLPEHDGAEVLQRLGESIQPGGTLLFTTHGSFSMGDIERYTDAFAAQMARGTFAAERARLEGDFASKGFAYAAYEHYLGADLGMTWHSRDYVEELAGERLGSEFKQLFFEDRGLDNHQDVYVYHRVGRTTPKAP